MTGTVKWFNGTKGFGFVTTDDGQDAFVHYSQIDMSGFKVLEENERVSFDLVDTPKGLQAKSVKRIK
ncbi:MAG: cold-shock protein [Candidatus Methanofastidiosum sp.]|nr:cold-shock protein [Methanofastidiosum sp.]